uniref:Transposase n=1 Tax=Panagrellus redivivus TaxID=6233 RepID=A0A7E4UYN6_PANRE
MASFRPTPTLGLLSIEQVIAWNTTNTVAPHMVLVRVDKIRRFFLHFRGYSTQVFVVDASMNNVGRKYSTPAAVEKKKHSSMSNAINSNTTPYSGANK